MSHVQEKFSIIVYMDDVGIATLQAHMIDSFVDELKSCGFGLTKEGSFSKYLRIKFDKNKKDGTITLAQKGLIKKILTAIGLTNCNPNRHPAAAATLGIDLDGSTYTKTFNYTSIVSMLLYLSTNTHPDISFAVSQVAQFNHNPEQSHMTTPKNDRSLPQRNCQQRDGGDQAQWHPQHGHLVQC